MHKEAGPTETCRKPTYPSPRPWPDDIRRNPIGSSCRNLFTKPSDVGNLNAHEDTWKTTPSGRLSRDVATHRDTSGKLSAVEAPSQASCHDTPPPIETPQGSCQDTSPLIKTPQDRCRLTRTPRVRDKDTSEDTFTSKGYGHLRTRTLDEGAHFEGTDTSRGHVTYVTTGYLYQIYRTSGISPEP